MNDALLVGYARVDITPTEPVPLGGLGNADKRISTSVHDRLYTTCIAFTDADGETALLYTSDLIRAIRPLSERARAAIREVFDIAPEKIMFSGSHTHSGPEIYIDEKIPYMVTYKQMFVNQAVEAARIAMADRKPASLFIGRTADTDRMNFVRHYKKNEAGEWCAHQTDPDPLLQMLKIVRQGGQDILMMNWQAHPCMAYPHDRFCVSSDYIGPTRSYLEEKAGGLFVFFQGAAGNLTVCSKVKGEELTDDAEKYGALLGECALKALENMTPVAGGKIRSASRIVSLPVDHSDDHMVPDAEKIAALWHETNNGKEVKKAAAPYGINSPYHALAILRRANSEDYRDMELCALAIGELGITFSPYEMFCQSGEYVREHSPFDATFVISCANDAFNYLPSEIAFEYGCYEKDNRNFPRGSAEMLAYNFVSMLNRLKSE